ncbi:MAG: hypothetical protein K0M70_02975 [Arenimonas sp.]|uniref:DUF6932 family protein n=1 Tax=Arenimonas sp. TaxID=1872635 RepID=UPI0025C55CCE|nr:hypothetical protein [Arenimonas sp.]MBW8366805.1 hypothetical protein [Arenimonas sp.]
MSKKDFLPLLPAGFHALDWAGLEALCVAPFPTSSSRGALASQLHAFLTELRGYGLSGQLWIDGSFVTDKPDPSDIDLIWVPDPGCLPQFLANAGRLDQLFGTTRGAKAIFQCDAYFVDPADTNNLAYWRGLFGFCHDAQTPKGLILATL